MNTRLVVNRHRPVARDELSEALWREPRPLRSALGPNPLLARLVSADREDDFPPCVTLLEQLVGLAHVVESEGGSHGHHELSLLD